MALVTLIKVKGLHKRNQYGDPRSHLGAEANRVSDLWPGHGAVPSPFWQYEYYQPSFCRRAQRAFCTISFFLGFELLLIHSCRLDHELCIRPVFTGLEPLLKPHTQGLQAISVVGATVESCMP